MNNPNETESLKRRGRPTTGQAKTAAQRMQERRQRMKHGETGNRDKGGEREITVVLTITALNALRRMAKRDGVTKKQLLDALLLSTEDRLLQGFDEAELERYWGETGSSAVKPLAPAQDADERQHEDAPTAAPSIEKAECPAIGASPAATPVKYKGVYPHKASGKWQAQCRENGKPKALGLFDTPEEANAAREAYLAKRATPL